MHFKSIISVLVLICSVSAQAQASADGSLVASTTESSGISRLLFWFKRPEKDATGGIAASPRPSDHEDTSVDTLPQESTDRMINDAISERILDESRQQQTISGSPFIEDPNKNDDDHQMSSTELRPQHLNLTSDRTGYGKSAANQPTDALPLTEALRIVSTANLTGCVARVICELSCNANAYGSPGRVVFRNMIKIQFDQSIQGDDIKFFRQAAAKGRQIVQGKRDCKECYSIYSSCNSSSQDLVAVSAMFKL